MRGGRAYTAQIMARRQCHADANADDDTSPPNPRACALHARAPLASLCPGAFLPAARAAPRAPPALMARARVPPAAGMPNNNPLRATARAPAQGPGRRRNAWWRPAAGPSRAVPFGALSCPSRRSGLAAPHATTDCPRIISPGAARATPSEPLSRAGPRALLILRGPFSSHLTLIWVLNQRPSILRPCSDLGMRGMRLLHCLQKCRPCGQPIPASAAASASAECGNKRCNADRAVAAGGGKKRACG